MVISGVAEQLPERISHLIYLDAMVPNDGQSAQMICGDLWEAVMAFADTVQPFRRLRQGVLDKANSGFGS